MAKAMVKKGTENRVPVRQYYCVACGEWDNDVNWTEYDCVRFSKHSQWRFYDDSESLIFESGVGDEIVVYAHEACDHYFANGIEERERGGPTWVCGTCGWESQDKASVMGCCL